jgi:hypothetical protein
MSRTAVQGALLLLCACGSTELPAPTLAGLAPVEMYQNEDTPLSVRLTAQLPVKVDYSQRSAELQKGLTLRIGGEEVAELAVKPGLEASEVTGMVPAGRLPVGPQDVRLTLADGREAVLPQAFNVKPPLAVSGFAFDSIPDQRAGVPFTVTIRAQGGDAARFEGSLTLSSNRDAQNRAVVPPRRIGPFQRGEYRQQLTIEAQNGNVTLEVTDAMGKTGRSNPFKVQ